MIQRYIPFLAACTILAGLLAATTAPAPGASASVVVSATVPSATNISTLGCQAGTAGATYLGTVLPGSTAIGSGTCDVTFGSSNDTSMLRVTQDDGRGLAMHGQYHALDPAFDVDGIADVDVMPAGDDDVRSVFPERGSDKIVAFGRANGGATDDTYMLRLLADGSPDPSFGGGDGIVIIDLGAEEGLESAIEDPDGTGYYLVGGRGPGGLASDMFIAKVDATGALDTSFNGTGWRTYDTPLSGWEWMSTLQRRTTGSGWYATSGNVWGGGFLRDRILRLTDDFDLDPTFDGDGIADLPATREVSCGSLREAQDGRLTCIGSYAVTAARTDAIIVRLMPDGSLDSSLAGDGMAEIPLGVLVEKDDVVGYTIRPDGTMLLTGSYDSSGGIPKAYIASITAAGALDASFGGDGWEPIALPGHLGFVLSIAEPYPTGSGFFVGGSAVDLAPTPIVTIVFGHIDDSGAWVPGDFGTDGFEVTDIVASANTYEAPLTTHLGADGAALVGAASQEGDVVSHIARFATSTVPDYALGVTDWNDGTGAFGLCLAGSANTTDDWGIGACDGTDAATWHAVPADDTDPQSRVAHAASSVQNASVSLRFGLRAPADQPPDVYAAHIDLTVIAPYVP